MCVLQVQEAEVGEGQSSWESVAEGWTWVHPGGWTILDVSLFVSYACNFLRK